MSVMKKHYTHYFSVSMNYTECEEIYLSHVKYLVVTDSKGKRIQMPKENLKKFVTHAGLHGNFAMKIDENNKIVNINFC